MKPDRRGKPLRFVGRLDDYLRQLEHAERAAQTMRTKIVELAKAHGAKVTELDDEILIEPRMDGNGNQQGNH